MPVPDNQTWVEFSVAFTNESTSSHVDIAPVVAAEHYSGAPGPNHITDGDLERYSSSTGTWQNLGSLGEGMGMDFMGTGDGASFSLPPGRTVSIQYRMDLRADDQPGTLGIDAIAAVPGVVSGQQLGTISVPLVVTST
jgi:hypothetical protein